MINQMAKSFATVLVNNNEDLSSLSSILNKNRNKNKEYTKEELIEVLAYTLSSLPIEVSKVLITLFIAYLLDILLPTFVVVLTFSLIRVKAGGFHMDTYLKCLLVGTILQIGGGYLALILNSIELNKFQLCVLILVSYFISYSLTLKFAPKDSPNKLISNEFDRKRLKKSTLNRLMVINIFLIILTLTTNNQLIVISVVIGILIELMTIIPDSEKTFSFINIIKY